MRRKRNKNTNTFVNPHIPTTTTITTNIGGNFVQCVLLMNSICIQVNMRKLFHLFSKHVLRVMIVFLIETVILCHFCHTFDTSPFSALNINSDGIHCIALLLVILMKTDCNPTNNGILLNICTQTILHRHLYVE